MNKVLNLVLNIVKPALTSDADDGDDDDNDKSETVD
jgi:hypothetical protein